MTLTGRVTDIYIHSVDTFSPYLDPPSERKRRVYKLLNDASEIPETGTILILIASYMFSMVVVEPSMQPVTTSWQ